MTTTSISDILDRASVGFLMLKTRMTLDLKNDELTASFLSIVHDNLSILMDETTPDMYTDDEAEYMAEMANFILDMSHHPDWQHLFEQEESE